MMVAKKVKARIRSSSSKQLSMNTGCFPARIRNSVPQNAGRESLRNGEA